MVETGDSFPTLQLKPTERREARQHDPSGPARFTRAQQAEADIAK